MAAVLIVLAGPSFAQDPDPPKVEVPKGSAPSEDKRGGEGGREMPVERGKAKGGGSYSL